MASKEEYNTIEVENNFNALTPIDDAELGIYEKALDFVFANDNVKNVAISGSYGAGKSSILASYKKIHSDKRFLHISLAHFRPENQNADEEIKNEVNLNNQTTSTETILEGKIINQLIHQILPERIPRTNFRVKKETSRKQNIKTAFLGIIYILLGFYIICFSYWDSLIKTLTLDWLKNIFAFSQYTESRFVAGLVFIIISGIFAYRFIKLQENQHIIKKAKASGVEIEIFEESKESYFDKYLNEVLYLFENANADIIVFEDIDRYDSSRIFERLHEINTLVNNNCINKPLRFFYLLKDDIFISKDRTKFFDFIIPIVPVVDGSNSFNKFLDCFSKSGIVCKEEVDNSSINLDFLQGLSLYVDDMRILQNICNEYIIYHNRISTTEQNPNKMLALITYKNLFPRDFAELQLGQGFLFEVVGGKGKERLISTEKTRLESSIKQLNIELCNVKAESLIEDELSFIYAKKIWNNNAANWSAENCKQQLLSQKQSGQHKIIIDEYEKRVVSAANNSESKENRITRIERELLTLNDELQILNGKRLCEIITRENINTFFNETVFMSETGVIKSFTEIKDNPYFPMLKYLVRESFIDETYSEYMTYFYENSLSRNDKIFLRSVTDKKAKEPSYKLDKTDMVISRLPLKYLKQEETLNYDLFEFLLLDYCKNKKYLDKTKVLIEQIHKENLYDFIVDYTSKSSNIDNLLSLMGIEWKSFLNDFFEYFQIPNKPSEPINKNDIFLKRIALTLFRLIGKNKNSLTLIDDNSKAKLIEYISNNSDFLVTDTIEVKEISVGIKLLNIKFTAISNTNVNKELLRLVYENNSYAINHNNIVLMLKEFYSVSDISIISSKYYSIIMSNKESPLAKYINSHIDTYMDMVLENCDKSIFDSHECAILIINNIEIEKTKRITYIDYLKTTISMLQDIEDTDLWESLLNNANAIEYSAVNIITYFKQKCENIFDETIINFINKNENIITFGEIFESDDQKKTFFRAIVKAITLNNNIYKGFVKQFEFYYKHFKIEDLSIDKLKILDEIGKIGMTIESLQFIRENYKDYLHNFIINQIKEYVELIANTSIFVLEEMVILLDKKIDDSYKIKLLENTQEKISIQNKLLSDKIIAYILQHNFDENDFEYFIHNYDKFEKETKLSILNLSVQQIEKLITTLNNTSRKLIDDIISSQNVLLKIKQKLFISVAIKATDDEIKKWLSKTGLEKYLLLYEERTRPTFENTEISTAILEIFKNRNIISEYKLNEKTGKYQIRKTKTFLSNKNENK